MLPLVVLVWTLLTARVQRALSTDDKKDFGASALEWAIIAALSVLMASIIGAVVYKLVADKGKAITDCTALQAKNTTCDTPAGP